MRGGSILFKKWPETPATVWSVYRASSGSTGFFNTVIFNYQVDRRYYSSEISTLKTYTAGQVFPLRVNPRNPRQNELAVRNKVFKVTTIVLLALMAVVALYFTFLSIPRAGPGGR